MSEEEYDPIADLIDKKLTIAEREWTITGSPSWSKNYLLLTSPGADGSGMIDMICRPTGTIRRHLQLAGQ